MKAPHKQSTNNRKHYNAEQSQESKLNTEYSKTARQNEFYNRQESIIQSWSEETRAKHSKHETKKENVDILSNMKIEILESKMDEIVDKILKYMEKNPGKNPLEKFASVLAKYKQIDDEQIELKKSVGLQYRTYYQELMLKLVKANINAMPYVPADVLTRAEMTITLGELNAEQLSKIQTNIESNPSIFYNRHFKEKYLKFFPDYITRMSEFSDIVFALKLKPSAYLNLSESFKLTLDQNPNLFKSIANRAPSALKYMDKKDLYRFGNEFCGSVGVAIMQDPDILNSLDNDFFEKNNPKFVFSGNSKAKVLSKVENYLSRFPTLKTWLNYHENQIWISKKIGAKTEDAFNV